MVLYVIYCCFVLAGLRRQSEYWLLQACLLEQRAEIAYYFQSSASAIHEVAIAFAQSFVPVAEAVVQAMKAWIDALAPYASVLTESNRNS